jgi:alkylation response protein AidB-like acyl-CoA dehydrogenase
MRTWCWLRRRGSLLLFAAPVARRAAQRRASGALKEKLGNRSNASSEVEFYAACGWLVGEEGDGVRQILKMGGLTRFDCAQPCPDASGLFGGAVSCAAASGIR